MAASSLLGSVEQLEVLHSLANVEKAFVDARKEIGGEPGQGLDEVALQGFALGLRRVDHALTALRL